MRLLQSLGTLRDQGGAPRQGLHGVGCDIYLPGARGGWGERISRDDLSVLHVVP